MSSKKVAQRIVVSLAIASALGAGAAGVRAATQSETLTHAVYDGQDTAGQVYQTMKSGQRCTGERIESYAVVSKDVKGRRHETS
jgi:hypothetical protein